MRCKMSVKGIIPVFNFYRGKKKQILFFSLKWLTRLSWLVLKLYKIESLNFMQKF
jgi:hypothetical protein